MTMPPTLNTSGQGQVESRYQKMDAMRQNHMQRVCEHAEYTIPRLLPNITGVPQINTELVDQYSSKTTEILLARVAKTADALFPPNGIPFFQLGINPVELARVLGLTGEEPKIQLEDAVSAEQIQQQLPKMLAAVENQVISRLQSSNYRDTLHKSGEHVEVIGDVLIQQEDDYNFKLYKINQFVLERDGSGRIRRIITRDWVKTELLPDDLRAKNNGRPRNDIHDQEPFFREMFLDVEAMKWTVRSEFRGETWDDGEYDDNVFPYYHRGWSRVDGEDYSRSPVEEHFGSVRAIEQMESAFTMAAAAGARGLITVDPSGFTTMEEMEEAEPWGFISARSGDIDTVRPDIGTHLSYISAYLQDKYAEIERAWGVNSASSLTGERVTATQIQQVSQEVNQTQGPVLTHDSKFLQPALVRRCLHLELKEDRLDETFRILYESGAIEIQIKTGIDALGRQLDTARLHSLMQTVYSLGDERMINKLNASNLLEDLIKNTGLDIDRYSIPDETLQAQAQAAKQQALLQQAGEQAISSVGSIAEKAAG